MSEEGDSKKECAGVGRPAATAAAAASFGPNWGAIMSRLSCYKDIFLLPHPSSLSSLFLGCHQMAFPLRQKKKGTLKVALWCRNLASDWETFLNFSVDC